MTVRTLGKKFQNITINGNAVFIATLIAPQDNPHGLILRSLTDGREITYGTSRPTGDRFDLTQIRVPSGYLLTNDVFVPAGNGVFMNTSADFVIPVQMSWDVLSADGTVA
ncbi:3-methyladenine DNA glycosylase [Pseudomonas sp. 32A]|uniref:3-methyladenine DNA glycosylase n=1 Tax=Pseudomonas sp. 32A TaxID=651185 RepID=UPI0040463352